MYLRVNGMFRQEVFVNGRLFSFFRLCESHFFNPTMFQVGHLVITVHTASLPLNSVPVKTNGANVRKCFLCFVERVAPRGLQGFIMWELLDRVLHYLREAGVEGSKRCCGSGHIFDDL